jgi:hypothetical protein
MVGAGTAAAPGCAAGYEGGEDTAVVVGGKASEPEGPG